MRRAFIKNNQNIGLSIMQRDDIPAIFNLINDPEVNRFLRSPWQIYYLDGEFEWFDHLSKNPDKNRVFPVINMESDELMGLIGLHSIDIVNGYATVGYMYGKKYWGHGYASSALSLLKDYSFRIMHLRKLISSVFEINGASRKVLEKNKFVYIGKYTKQHYVPDHGYQDEFLFECFNQDY
ncbi:MAG: GNAT family N-acetyltransferase [Thermoplasmataceae archaeon]